MPLTTSGADTGRYIIRSPDSHQLAGVIADIRSDPDMQLLDTIGPVGDPHTVVVDLPHAKADSLAQRFRATQAPIIIEPDRPLSMFEPSGGW